MTLITSEFKALQPPSQTETKVPKSSICHRKDVYSPRGLFPSRTNTRMFGRPWTLGAEFLPGTVLWQGRSKHKRLLCWLILISRYLLPTPHLRRENGLSILSWQLGGLGRHKCDHRKSLWCIAGRVTSCQCHRPSCFFWGGLALADCHVPTQLLSHSPSSNRTGG